MRTDQVVELMRQFQRYGWEKGKMSELSSGTLKLFARRIKGNVDDVLEIIEAIEKDDRDLDTQLRSWMNYDAIGDIADVLDTLNEPVEPKKRGRPKSTVKDEERNLEDVLVGVKASIEAKFNTVDLPIMSPGNKLEVLKKDWIQGLINSKVTFKEFQSFVEEFKETVSELYFENAVLEEVK